MEKNGFMKELKFKKYHNNKVKKKVLVEMPLIEMSSESFLSWIVIVFNVFIMCFPKYLTLNKFSWSLIS